MLKHWQKLSRRIFYKNPWWTYKIDTFEIPGGVSGEYHYVYTRGSSMVVPITGEGEVLLVNQYRYLRDQESLEFPCGSIKAGQNYLETAHAELAEETGYQAGVLKEIGAFNPYNGVTSEICRVFLGTELSPAAAQPDLTEEFELRSYTPAALEALIREQVIWDGMTLAAWMFARTGLISP